MKYYELTAYPNLFKNTYWGNFTYDENNNLINQRTIFFRNCFIKDYEIVKYVKLSNAKNVHKFITEFCPEGFIDHLEIYKNSYNDYVILTSPYYWNKKIPDHFCQIDRLYSTQKDNYSYICVLSLKEIKEILKN